MWVYLDSQRDWLCAERLPAYAPELNPVENLWANLKDVELVRGLGADRVIDYTAEDFTRDTQTYDVVLDAVGKSSFGRCKRLLKPRGIYLSSDLGPLSQNPILALITPLLRGKKVMFPIPRDNQEMVRYFKELLESGEFRPVIDRRYRLDQIVEAYTYVETGQKIGNVVISVDPRPREARVAIS